MTSRLLSISLGLNLALLSVAGYRAARSPSGGSALPATAPISEANRLTGRSLTLAPAAPDVAAIPVPLRWNEIESDDYPTYVANLRRTGCPEPILRRIIGAELKELYARKAFALVQEFHRDFWKIAARENVREYFEKTFGQQVKALGKESDTLLNQLVGEAVHEPAQSRHEMEGEQAGRLSSAEWAEYQLRQSGAAGEVQQLYGVDFSETELRNLAKAIDDYRRQTDSQAETEPGMLEQTLQTVLGPARFADLVRARSARYRELGEVASAFGQPREAAAEIFDLRLKSEKQSDEIRADRNRPTEEKQALLDDLQEQVEQIINTKFGAEAYQSYKAKNGRWISSLGRL